MPVWHLRGIILPGDEPGDVYVDGDRITFTPVPGAETIAEGGYLMPGLVDAHCHPGTSGIGEPLDEALLRAHGDELRAAGIAAVRVPGSAGRLPSWFGDDPSLPRVWGAGLAVAAEGGFFPGWGRPLPADRIPAAAVEESRASGGWCKLIVDWLTDDGGYAATMSAQVVAEATRAVRRAGGRVAAHSQHADGGTAAVAAGVDSVEHGMHLPERLLETMAAQRTALVPTAVTFARLAPLMEDPQVPVGTRTWFGEGWRRHPGLIRAAYEAGVTVLAGTDLPPGHLTDEIRWLAEAGLPADVAVGAASWTARGWLGLPGIEEGAPADILAFDTDPRSSLDALEHPSRVIVRGRLVR
ncbi:amidohydrolase family protein [Nonomuraea cypriaca]|uniref:amidohydrolase family protein n=1 Tax=Nonomuraea cypriaca TaxID=1187855 RepID=UPI001A9C4E1B|nr:amidohydrolase family protein [Nonomuraea cypriaca]